MASDEIGRLTRKEWWQYAGAAAVALVVIPVILFDVLKLLRWLLGV